MFNHNGKDPEKGYIYLVIFNFLRKKYNFIKIYNASLDYDIFLD